MSSRTSKSQKIAAELRQAGNAYVRVKNPEKELMEKTAKHIEWLELLATGLSYADKKTIVTLTRRQKANEKKIAARDLKIAELKNDIKRIKQDHKDEIASISADFTASFEDLKEQKFEDLEDLREVIELEYIQQLVSSRESAKTKALKKTYRDILESSMNQSIRHMNSTWYDGKYAKNYAKYRTY